MQNLHNFQYDFIKLKIDNINIKKINYGNLMSHPTIKKCYTLSENTSFYSKNIKIFISKSNTFFLSSSIPYLKYNHNYIGLNEIEFKGIINDLSELIGINLLNAEIEELEYGAFETTSIDCVKYISQVIGLKNYELEKSNRTIKMFGNGKGLHYKLYDAVENAKYKKTFSRGKYPKDKLLKHEIKITKVKKVFRSILKVSDLGTNETRIQFHTMFVNHYRQLCVRKEINIEPLGDKFIDILFAGLKQVEQNYGVRVYELIKELIDKTELSSSQKSKRRKYLLELENQSNQKIKK